MAEKLKYVSPQYQDRLDNLSESLAAGRRQQLASAALQETVEFPSIQDTVEFPVIRADVYYAE